MYWNKCLQDISQKAQPTFTPVLSSSLVGQLDEFLVRACTSVHATTVSRKHLMTFSIFSKPICWFRHLWHLSYLLIRNLNISVLFCWLLSIKSYPTPGIKQGRRKDTNLKYFKIKYRFFGMSHVPQL